MQSTNVFTEWERNRQHFHMCPQCLNDSWVLSVFCFTAFGSSANFEVVQWFTAHGLSDATKPFAVVHFKWLIYSMDGSSSLWVGISWFFLRSRIGVSKLSSKKWESLDCCSSSKMQPSPLTLKSIKARRWLSTRTAGCIKELSLVPRSLLKGNQLTSEKFVFNKLKHAESCFQ